MDGKVYRIKPPRWIRIDEVVSIAVCLFGRLRVRLTTLNKYAATCEAKHGDTVYVDELAYVADFDEAKAAAEQWYLAKLREALIEASPASPKEEDR